MAGNLRERLARIKNSKKTEDSRVCPKNQYPALKTPGWSPAGSLTLRREVTIDAPSELQAVISPSMAILVPDLRRIAETGKKLPAHGDFLFFDLETTGLSGGAGTVAFLAAFGRLSRNGSQLRITQYLLLDYPGENDFLEALLAEFKNNQQIIVSFNGKSFDSQILKTRCLMNGIKNPEYLHADLLHPARRLWKRVFPNCRQGTIETELLGIDRSNDIPGSLAPEIWFDFLKTGREERLMGICEHNCRDIAGLASILAAMNIIAADPCAAAAKYRYDLEQLALYWRDFARHFKKSSIFGTEIVSLQETAAALLRLAADKNYPQAAYVYALDQLRSADNNNGRNRMLNIAKGDFPQTTKAAALRALAIDSERRLGDIAFALEFTEQGLKLQLTGTWQEEFERRAQRLEKKL